MKGRHKILNELLKCPFCNGEAEIKEHNHYNAPAFRVHCTKCGITTNSVIVGTYMRYNDIAGVNFTYIGAKQEAIRIWNNRTAWNKRKTPNEFIKVKTANTRNFVKEKGRLPEDEHELNKWVYAFMANV